MNARVRVDVDPGERLACTLKNRLCQPPVLTGEAEDAAIVVGVGVDVEQPRAAALEGVADRRDRLGVATLGDVRNREQHPADATRRAPIGGRRCT